MRIEKNNSPLFGATLINNKAKIFNTVTNKDEFVSYIKIDTKNLGDINALEKIAKHWQGGNFVTNIYHAARAIRNDSKYYNHNQIFAITKQSSDFEQLDSDQILGVVHISPFEDKSLFIEHIEVKPSNISYSNTQYKGIGSAIIKELQKITNKIRCFPLKSLSVKNFYFKNGFEEISPSLNLFVWSK